MTKKANPVLGGQKWASGTKNAISGVIIFLYKINYPFIFIIVGIGAGGGSRLLVFMGQDSSPSPLGVICRAPWKILLVVIPGASVMALPVGVSLVTVVLHEA